MMGQNLVFDRAKSNRVDSTIGEERNSSKTSKRKRRFIRIGRLIGSLR